MFKRGISGNPAGRPQGATNKTTEELRNTIQSFIENNIQLMQENFDLLEAKDKLLFIEKMLNYTLPRMQATQLDAKINDERSMIVFRDVSGMTREDIKKLEHQ